MATGPRRLPEDSVVASLSEIQAILQTSDAVRVQRPAAKPATETPVPTTAAGSAPVPSAAELRASREARWREEMLDASRPAQSVPPSRRTRTLIIAAGLALAVSGAAGAYLLTRTPEAPPPPAVVVAPRAQAVAPASPVAPPTVASVESESPAAAVDQREPPPVRGETTQRTRSTPQKARPATDDLDAVFGPRRTPVSAQPKPRAPAPANRKKTRADAQLDSVLDSL
jgi:hypothetical protein